MTLAETEAYAENVPVKVLANTDAVQGVYHTQLNIWAVNFFTSGQCDAIESDTAASIMCRHSQNQDTLYLAVSDPTWKCTRQNIILDGEYRLISANPSDKVSVTVSEDHKTCITINSADRMGMGQQVVLQTVRAMDSPLITSDINDTSFRSERVYKNFENGQIVIHKGAERYSILGEQL